MGEEKGLVDNLLERGTPRNEQLKKIARERSEKLKKVEGKKKFYSAQGDKIHLYTVKSKGLFSSYIGRASKMKDFVVMKKKSGEWLEFHQIEDFTQKAMAELSREK